MSKRLTLFHVDSLAQNLILYLPMERLPSDWLDDLSEHFELFSAKDPSQLSNLINTIEPDAILSDLPPNAQDFDLPWIEIQDIDEDPALLIRHRIKTFLKERKDSSTLELATVPAPPPATSEDKKELPELVGTSPAISDAYSIAKKVAPSRVSVHLHGETGTGKEMMARVIHQLSDRSNKPMIIVNCSALNPQLLESELFGHEKGAFTGATQRRIGRIEEANGSTLFLDEIGEIDETTQVKLLRILSDRTLERVGGNQSIPVDFRLITATHKNLEQLVEEGKFREDLYYRIHIVKIDIPPLRDRGIDIISLTKLFLEQFALENNLPFKPPTEEVIRLLLTYRWPGNVRQLKAAIEHALVFSEGDMIQPQDLPYNITQKETLDIDEKSLLTVAPSAVANLAEEDLNLENIERKTIQRALEITSNNRVNAAKILGISRRTLYRKIDHYEL